MGSPRSGSTWLLNLLAADPAVVKIDEPGIGAQLGVTMTAINGLRPIDVEPERARMHDMRRDNPDYFFCDRYRESWEPQLRELLLRRVAAQLRDQGGRLALIKEPHGSMAADVLLESLPGSRLIFLLRDGRDVVDSELDAGRAEAWAGAQLDGFEPSDADRLGYVRDRAHAWLWKTAIVERAYAAHPSHLRRLVRYEELRAEPEPILEDLGGWLGLDPDLLGEAAGRLAFERVPERLRGSGQFVRAASPGKWRENLSAAEQEEIARVIGPKLRQLGYE